MAAGSFAETDASGKVCPRSSNAMSRQGPSNAAAFRMVVRFTVVLLISKIRDSGSCSATTVAGSTALPFVISTGAPKERSGEICGPYLGNFFQQSVLADFKNPAFPGLKVRGYTRGRAVREPLPALCS